MQKRFQHIAIVRLSALGDIINASVVMQFIQSYYPDIKVDWICEESFAPLLKRLRGIEAIHTINLKKLKKERSLSLLKQTLLTLKELPSYDVVVDMQGLLKSAIVSRLTCKYVHGYDRASIREPLATYLYSSTTHIAYKKNIILRNVALFNDLLHVDITPKSIEGKEPIFQIKSLKKERSIALVIGASWPSKIFPIEKHIQLCNAIDHPFYVIWGSEKEKKEAMRIVSTCNNAELAPKMTLMQLVDFISSMELVIGNDTGPTHLAWAQNIASITLFGPTNERMIFETPKNIAIHSKSEVDILKIDKEDYSIQDIDVNDVIIATKKLLGISQ